MPKRLIKAFPLYMGKSGCDYHRIRLPFICGAAYYDNDNYIGFELSRFDEFLAKSEVFIFNRMFPAGLNKLEPYFEGKKIKLVVDLDDWYKLPDYHPNYRQYKDIAEKEIIKSLKRADLVTVTTERLRDRILQHNPNTHVVSNAIPFFKAQFQLPQPREENELFNFIYTGQSSHLEDVRLMQAGIRRASRMKNIQFTVAGFKEHKVWQAMAKVFDQGAPFNKIEARPLDDYMSVYDGADCSLVPLCFNDFNSCKSNLKLLEAASKKIPCIVSWVPPYRDEPDAPVLWVKRPEDWYDHIKFLAENRDYAKRLGEELYEWAFKKYHMDYWNKLRFELYNSVIE